MTATEQTETGDPLALAEWFGRSRLPIWSWIVVAWALCVFPAISLRAYHYEEGYIVAVARGVLENSDGWVPHWYGFRFVERPNLMAWIVALIGAAAGGVNQWVTRAPAVLSILAGCFLIFHMVRRYASPLAALFAALAFLISPLMLPKMIVAEPDGLVSVLLFGAFIVWWNGVEAGSIGIRRWFAIGGLLTVASFVKGPQPIAYFGLGVAAFHLLRREWASLSLLALTGAGVMLITAAWYWAIYQPGDFAVWMSHSRLTDELTVTQWVSRSAWFVFVTSLELLPALILAVPLVPGLWRPAQGATEVLVRALLLYSICCTAVLVFWPGANARYVMPALLTLAVLAGLAFDRYRGHWQVNAALCVAAALAFYQIVLCWVVMPAAPDLFNRSRRAASALSAAIAAHPATLYALDRDPYNVLAYIRAVRIVPLQNFPAVKAPAWVLPTSQSQEQSIRRVRPDLDIDVAAVVEFDPGRPVHLLYMRPKQVPR